jgi:ubiquitin C-terminal hydrolase
VPKDFIKKLREDNEVFRAAIHHDAHEFLIYLLNSIADNLLRQQNLITKLQNVVDSIQAEKETIPSNDSKPKTWVHELFEGIISSETKCLTCENINIRYEPFLDISLDIPHDYCSILACLQNFSSPELLSGRNKFWCDNCGGLQEAEKHLYISRTPRILALHLKRFKFVEELGQHVKLSHRVSFNFDLHISQRHYSLFGIIIHLGDTPTFGHYISLVKKSVHKWLLVDDHGVTEFDESFISRVFGSGTFTEKCPSTFKTLAKPGYGFMDGKFGNKCETSIDEEKLKWKKSIGSEFVNGCGYILFYESRKLP